MKKSLLGLLLLLVSVAANAQKFALIDMEYIMQRIPAYKEAEDRLQQSSARWQAEVEKAAKEAKALYEAYQKDIKKMTEAQRTQKEKEIVEKEKSMTELRRTYFGPEGEMNKLQQSLISPIEDDIYEAVKDLALRNGYAAVIDRASANGLIFASPQLDISNEVLAKLGYSN